ncbi:TetR family transcriptional regulator [Kineosporia rhizophila]|uniref:TetR/AcrR family transcriptional regulator n=1 Tax=Kineosporia TaxID=49184 RepID=UPI001E6398EE|nr:MULTISPECIES: TetR family transcriptional regulator [Kineosporia]MCE0537512.1 TetR family transcriptional regulator [Kineosporia rhizophila]GLY18986.1 TetR family transcriptional regulator [Kineosporia sp. NBRC 101677]
MARNEARRQALGDAGLHVLATQGARGLTHRAVDAAAGVPAGTTSNYFRSREALIQGLFDRIGERLAPAPEVWAQVGTREPTKALFAEYTRDIVRRLLAAPEATIALFELRLESRRRPELAGPLTAWQQAGFAADVDFNRAAGLPGTAQDIALFHYAVEGLVLDRLTTPIDPGTSVDEVVQTLVDRLLPGPS